MRPRRTLRTAAALAATGLLIAGCGGAGSSRNASDTTSTGQLDPASRVPASAVAFALVTTRPQGTLRTDLVQTLDKLAGPGAANRLATDFTRQLGSPADVRAFKRWVGPQIGIALTGLPTGRLTSNNVDRYVLLVAPSSQPSHLESYVAAHLHDRRETVQVAGGFVLVGGRRAVSQAVATSSTGSLAADPEFRSETAAIGGNQVATVFVRPRPLVQALTPLLKRHSAATSQQITGALSRLPATASVAMGLGAGADALRLDVVTHGLPGNATGPSTPADVGSLPGSSWLALAVNIGARSISQLRAALPGIVAQAQARAGATGTTVQGFLPFLERDVIPALGPMRLSVAGSSVTGLQAGMTLAPHDAAAGDRLLAALKRMLANVPLLTSRVGRQLVLSFGYADPRDLLSPSSSLAANGTYRSALAQLPAGSRVPFYMNFAPIATLGSLDSSPSDASTWRVVRRLRYLIAGGTRTHFRLVLAVR